MTTLACVRCGHSWHNHHQYDDDLGRYVPQPCDNWNGCGCKAFMSDDEGKTLKQAIEESR